MNHKSERCWMPFGYIGPFTERAKLARLYNWCRVAPGATVTLVAVPQLVFRGEKLFLEAKEWIADLIVLGLRVGNTEVGLGGEGQLPARIFAPEQPDRLRRVDMPACQAGSAISLQIVNSGSTTAPVIAWLEGKCVR